MKSYKTIYVCEECGAYYKNEEKAAKCCSNYWSNKEINERKNLVRLNAETPEHIFELITKYAKKYMGLSVKFKNIDLRWNLKNDLKMNGWITGTVRKCRNLNEEQRAFHSNIDEHEGISIGCVLGDNPFYSVYSFNGVELSSGCPADDFDIGVNIDLSKFPKIMKKYKRLEHLRNKKDKASKEWRNRFEKRIQKVNELVDSDPGAVVIMDEMEQTKQQIEELKGKVRKLKDDYSKRVEEITEENKKSLDKISNVPKKFDYDEEELNTLKHQFFF